MQAYEDAICWRAGRLAAPCADCSAAQDGRCDDHACDTSLIASYRQAAQRLARVGISCSWPRRMSEHIADRPWFPTDGVVEFEEYQDRESALAAEELAIRKERPPHNLQHSTVRIKVTVSAEVEFSPGGIFATAALASGGLLLAKWAADFLANWWVRRQGARQGVPVQVPPVRNPFTEESGLATFFNYMLIATAVAQPDAEGRKAMAAFATSLKLPAAEGS